MTVKSVDEIFEARSGSWTVGDGRKYTRVFRVITNNQYDGPNVAIQAVGISRGDQYTPLGSDANLEVDTNAYCNTISAVQEDGDSLGWIVTAEYGPYSALWAGGGPDQNPLLQPIDVSWSQRTQEVAADVDVYGKPIVNTAGDPYDPPVMKDLIIRVLTVVRNEAAFNLSLVQQYADTQAINSDAFAGYAPLFAKVESIIPKSVFHQDVGWYYQMTYTFELISPLSPYAGLYGWRKSVINQGIRAINTTSGALFHVTLKGIPVTEPVLLDKNGFWKQNNPNVPYYNVYQLRPELPFATFNFNPLALIGQRTGFVSGYGPQ
jgi:hypothetical protein